MARPRVKTTQEKIDDVNLKIENLKAEIKEAEAEKAILLEQLRNENIAALVSRIDNSQLSFEEVIALIDKNDIMIKAI